MTEAEEAEAEAAQAVVITVAVVAVVHCPGQHLRAVRLPSNAGGESEQGSWFPVSIKS